MQTPLPQTWELDSIFEGGSSSRPFVDFLNETDGMINQLETKLKDGKTPQLAAEADGLIGAVELMQQIMLRIRESGAYTSCLTAADMKDKDALQLSARVQSQNAAYKSALTLLDRVFTATADDVWDQLLALPQLQDVAFSLHELRRRAREKLAPELEALAGDLAVDGYHGWSSLYDTAVRHFSIETEEDGKTVRLSAGQAFNQMHTGDREKRAELFSKWEQAWAEKADFCADALNHLGGFRLQLYKHRGWDAILKEPLDICRMKQETLDAMWGTIASNKELLVRYLERKAKLLGLEQLSWHDVGAPLGESTKKVAYDDGAAMILEQFRQFSPRLADFSAMAFEKGWIEAEDRDGKRPGGFCTALPLKQETRIFMTYSGTMDNVSTLAHELGHAYHQHVMNELPPLSQRYAMNVAETASTLAENIISSAAVSQAADPAEKLAIVEDNVQRVVAFLMNIHARFIFETNFYSLRKQGTVSVERLNELMTEAQKEAYCGALSEYHPHFWASKLHFYITGVPFYNFPYTFGFLFSAGIYAQAEKEDGSFEDRYDALLRDTGRMSVEDLAQKHLGVDLTAPAFWQDAVDLVLKDVKLFLELTEYS